MCAACGGLVDATRATAEDANLGRLEFAIPAMACGSCVARIEKQITGLQHVVLARANLTLKRLVVRHDDNLEPEAIVEALHAIAFDAYRIDEVANEDDEPDARARQLLRAMAVAGFGAANIMLLSVSSWSGADGSTRDFFHLVSGLIAVPVIAYSGRPFFQSALRALSVGRLNMDVPISLAVLLAVGMSVFQTFTSQPDAYFDAAVMLLFFLLIGRYLDQLMRVRARSAVISLSEYAARDAIEVLANGDTRALSVADIRAGMQLRILPGARVPVDCRVSSGRSDVDRAMVTGENEPVTVVVGDTLESGVLNLTGAIEVQAEKPADQSFLAEISRMLDAAEQGKGRYVGLADRAAQIYTPAVHLTALGAFAGWMVWSGGDWQLSLLVAISTLIITCPCALGLAVPVAHVIAASRLFRWGLLMRNGGALERLAGVTIAVFDKTGTLTSGRKTVVELPKLNARERNAFGALAANSSHPAAMGVAAALPKGARTDLSDIVEKPGIGISANWRDQTIALVRGASGTYFESDGTSLGEVKFAEALREGSCDAVASLTDLGVLTQVLSGDSEDAVQLVGDELGIGDQFFGQTPAGKVAHLQALRATTPDNVVLMVGDGINDAPCLAAADVSIAPSSASDVGRQAADFVLARSSLAPLPRAIWLARQTNRIVLQNFGIALAYNLVAVPLAVAGHVTPLIAALAMSGSSIVVIGNSLRLSRMQPPPRGSAAGHGIVAGSTLATSIEAAA
ncbi:MAG: heavy metal translocating P-type ATPase [Pseudomonadota bacterium]